MENKNNNDKKKMDKYMVMAGFALDCFEKNNIKEYGPKESLITENIDYIINDIAFALEEKVTEIILRNDEKEVEVKDALFKLFQDNNLPFILLSIEEKEEKILKVLRNASATLELLVGRNNIKNIIDDHIKLNEIENSKEGFSKYK